MLIHVVRRGETLSSIAARYGVLPAMLSADNGLSSAEPLLAAGQALVVRIPRTLHTVAAGETLYSVARRYGVSVRTLLRRNFYLHGRPALRAGDVLAIDYEDEMPLAVLGVNAYAYPFIGEALLASVLPYLTYLTPFTYGVTAEGDLVPPEDGALLSAAAEAGAAPLLHLSTLTAEGGFSSETAATLLRSADARAALTSAVVRTAEEKGYYGLDVDFEYLPPELRETYANFIGGLRDALTPLSRPVLVALAPKTSADQSGLLYEAHDYALLGEAADAVFLMTYEWGYAYGEPQSIAPLPQVRAVLDYALTEIPARKIFLGAPLYAYDWTLPYEAGVTRAETLSSRAAVELAARTGAEIFFDETARSPYFTYTDAALRGHIVWFEDARSMDEKIRLAAERGLQGMGFWNLTRELPQLWPLLDARISIETL